METHSDQALIQAWASFYVQHTVREAPDSHEETCPICQEKYCDSEEMRLRIAGIPSCSHTFGHICLRQWFGTNSSGVTACPMCRTEWVAGPARSRYDQIQEIRRWVEEFDRRGAEFRARMINNLVRMDTPLLSRPVSELRGILDRMLAEQSSQEARAPWDTHFYRQFQLTMLQLGVIMRPPWARLETEFTTVPNAATARSSSPSPPSPPQRNVRARRNAISLPDSSPAYSSSIAPAKPPEEFPPLPLPAANSDAITPTAPATGPRLAGVVGLTSRSYASALFASLAASYECGCSDSGDEAESPVLVD